MARPRNEDRYIPTTFRTWYATHCQAGPDGQGRGTRFRVRELASASTYFPQAVTSATATVYETAGGNYLVELTSETRHMGSRYGGTYTKLPAEAVEALGWYAALRAVEFPSYDQEGEEFDDPYSPRLPDALAVELAEALGDEEDDAEDF